MKKNNLHSERNYIIKREIKAFFYSVMFYFCRIFPIKKNKIVFWTFEGSGGFCCNPQYIAKEILKRKKENDNNLLLTWLVDDINAKFPEGIVKIKNTLWNRVFQLSTAGFWIGNSRTLYGTKKRKGQVYIQTWHGTLCIKPIGKYRGGLFPKIAYLVSKADSKLIDYVLSGSDWCDIHYRDGLLYDGEIVRTGTPRCDILINTREEMRKDIRRMYGVPDEGKLLLYAPTFRGGSQITKRAVEKVKGTIDLKKLVDSLEQRFGGKWFIFTRLHPQLAAKNEYCHADSSSDRLIDVTNYPDMNELISVVDTFISDYSSAIFEAAILKIPCFIYADDLEDYIRERGDLFFDMYRLPFPVALNNDELVKNITNFDLKLYQKEVECFMREQGVTEDGHASERTVDLIERIMKYSS